MNDWQRPDGLLAIALDTFRTTVLPTLEGELRYNGLMIANALAIAQRQCERVSHTEDGPAAQGLAASDDAHRSSEDDATRQRIEAIRRGAADPGTPLHDSLREELLASTRHALEISNPRYLKRED